MIIPILMIVALALGPSQPSTPSPSVSGQTQQQQPKTPSATPQNNQPPVGSQAAPSSEVLQPPSAGPNQSAGAQDKQPPENRWALALNDVITALLTLGIGWVAWLQYQRMGISEAHTEIVERAYVNLSHTQPGVTFHEHPTGNPHDVRVTIRMSNSGNTPADVLGHSVTFVYGSELSANPDRPPVPTGDPIAVLMPHDFIDFWHNFKVPADSIILIGDAAIPSFVIGWVVYRDRFGKAHRSGYARRYIQAEIWGGNNLVFLSEPGYNYEEDLE